MVRASGAELAQAAYRSGYALPAFNVANLETTQGVLNAAEELASPVILQISQGAIAYAGYHALSDLVFEAAARAPFPVVVHLDHARDPQIVLRAIRDGFGSVMFDGSRLSFEENVRVTRSIVEAATAAGGCAVEAELGVIGGREDTSLRHAKRTVVTAEEAAAFVAQTGIHILAPALGSVHRMPEDSVELDVAAVRQVADACSRPLALHGGSGVKRTILRDVIGAGVAKVNISSAVTRALARGIRRVWEADPGEADLRVFMAAGRDEVCAAAADYMRLCGSADRAGTRRSRTGTQHDSEPE